MKAEMTKTLNGLSAVSVLREEGSALDKKKYDKFSGSLRRTVFVQHTPGVNLVPDSTALGIKFHF
jgi:hypothetical protein